ncbi:malto-oligosyltrehalose trehalohydrolase [Roseimaritima sediminicola]|uniref:malto-oligosyltrehalose trehalohydrolase n=1 Tax=Roseimaritima sediminicola TaxID=2662066 RepID=UPI0012984D12|nr:malto-oligosyltrehalose trehalohydrolase [Roseimaritima sediminicola]
MHHRFGPQFHDDGTVSFHVWAPGCQSLDLQWADESAEALAMTADEANVFTVRTPATAGDRYWFRLPSGALRPDPASRFQPAGVHGPSQLVDQRGFAWTDADFAGIRTRQMVLYELHVGTFTVEGTYTAAIERLEELKSLGINAIELLPVAQAAGSRNWGYDGVNLFAPSYGYGSPDDLRRLVDAAHRIGISVIMDVVYNHFGAEGNYLHEFGGYVSKQHQTPWGDAPNFDEPGSEQMRAFIIQNAAYWIEDFHLDGLRLDATHCMADHSPVHVVHEIGQRFEQLKQHTRRPLHLIAESNVYDEDLLRPLARRGHGFDAIWCDDFLHSVSALVRPEEQMSSREYRQHYDLDLTLRRGFVFLGGLGVQRRRIEIDEPVDPVPVESLVVSIQNHDFVGNHPHGRRLHQLTSLEAHRSAAALMLLYPAIPMLFMGEESAAEQPFFFFTDFGDEPLRKAVEEGRKAEYPQHDWTNVESPLSLEAFERSKLGEDAPHSDSMRRWYRQLISLRTAWQNDDLLRWKNLKAAWSEHDAMAAFAYRHEGRAGFALMRLHEPDHTPAPLQYEVDGDVLLHSSCEADDRRPNHWNLGAYSVLVGLGEVHRLTKS